MTMVCSPDEDWPKKPTLEELRKIEKALLEIGRRKVEHAKAFFQPYPLQQDFLDGGIAHTERLFMAGNRVGKSQTGAFEMACHLTGEYPDWWLGRRFNRPIKAWAACDTGINVRDVAQSKLCGPYGDLSRQGHGMIPKSAVNWEKDISLARGVTDLYDTVFVKHISGGKSTLTFKTYEQGRKKWQGEAVDVIWFDEEPEEDIYSEGITRLAPTRSGEQSGIAYMTFTPLQGKSKVVCRFLDKPSLDRGVYRMGLDDAPHIDEAEKVKMLERYLPHEREARRRGAPMLGSGQVFSTPPDEFRIPAFPYPRHWRYIWGVDFGIDHPFAAVLLGHDMDNDVLYVMSCYRAESQTPLQHCAAMKPALGGRGDKVPFAWPQDGWQRREFEGALTPTADIYRKHKMTVLSTHAQFPDGSNSTWAGILDMRERFASGRLKVFDTQTEWFTEYGEYHMKDGQIVKLRDDLMSATRVGIMAKRYARSVLWAPNTQDGRGQAESRVARDVDFSFDW